MNRPSWVSATHVRIRESPARGQRLAEKVSTLRQGGVYVLVLVGEQRARGPARRLRRSCSSSRAIAELPTHRACSPHLRRDPGRTRAMRDCLTHYPATMLHWNGRPALRPCTAARSRLDAWHVARRGRAAGPALHGPRRVHAPHVPPPQRRRKPRRAHSARDNWPQVPATLLHSSGRAALLLCVAAGRRVRRGRRIFCPPKFSSPKDAQKH
jgi:hypothetical protein